MSSNTTNMVKQILAGGDVRSIIANAEASNKMDEATKTVVRNGKKVRKQVKRKKRKKILTQAQKKAIKKAQKASKTSAARMQRKKSLKIARTLEGIHLGEEMNVEAVGIICPDCGGSDVVIQHDEENGATTFFCPDCESEFVLCNVDNLEDEDLAEDEDEVPEAYYDDESDEDADIEAEDSVEDEEYFSDDED